ncbi:hypothetical protein [Kitasatospora purpeofusca]|uniref:hypothetical protein n=1 Tax=Kitasatospora purpeofusca TaxID=67352 RepID=UPI0035D8F455
MRGAGEWGAVRAVVRWAGHPGTLAAVAVLLFNDHVGKRLWPGAVTGKVSDLAWMLVSPVVLALVLTPVLSLVPGLRLRGDRPAIAGLAATGAMFAFAKSGPWGGEVASAVWSWSGVPSRIQGDRSDLVALPALGVSWWLWKRSRAVRGPLAAPGSPVAPGSPAARRWWRTAAAALGVPLAVVAMVATSSDSSHDRAAVLWSKGSQPMLETSESWWTTRDGGGNWVPVSPGSYSGLVRADDRAEERTGIRGDDRLCVSPERLRCFRIRDDASPIEASEDGGLTWQLAFDPGERRRRPLPSEPAATPAAAPGGPSAESVSAVPRPPSAAPVVRRAQLLVTAASESWAVIANYPGAGLVLGTPDGVWTLRDYPVLVDLPVSEPPRHWPLGLPVAVAAGFAGVLAVAAVWLLRTTVPAGRSWELWFLLLRQGLCLYWVWQAAWLCGGELLWRIPGVLVAGVVTVPLLPILWALRHGPDRAGSRLLPLTVGGAVVAVLALLPYLRWAAHGLSAWSQASDQAFLCALAATVGGAVVGALTPPPVAPTAAAETRSDDPQEWAEPTEPTEPTEPAEPAEPGA